MPLICYMNFEKLSFQPTEEQKAHLTYVSKELNINNPTELIRKILDDHHKLTADDNGIMNIRPHNVMYAKRKWQTNAMQTKRDTICRHGDQSEASANSETVDKAELIVDTMNAYSAGDNIEDGRQSLRQGKKPVMIRQSDYFGSPLGKAYGHRHSEIPYDYDVHDQWSTPMQQISL